MNYPRIISRLCREPWLIRETTHEAMFAALESHMGGNTKARIMEDDEHEHRDPEDDMYSEVSGPYGVMAVIRVHGILGKHLSGFDMACGGCSLDGLQKMLKVADESQRVSKVLLHFHTPGGTVMGTPETADLIADIDSRKPVIGYTDGDCCSGGLYLASQCRRFYASQSSDVGSVGVRMVLLDYTKQLEMDGVKVNAISSGKYKLAGAYFKPLTDDEREMFQAESDRVYEKFKEAVVAVRQVDDKHMQGQVYAGEIAAEIGFTDGVIDDIDELIDSELSSQD